MRLEKAASGVHPLLDNAHELLTSEKTPATLGKTALSIFTVGVLEGRAESRQGHAGTVHLAQREPTEALSYLRGRQVPGLFYGFPLSHLDWAN